MFDVEIDGVKDSYGLENITVSCVGNKITTKKLFSDMAKIDETMANVKNINFKMANLTYDSASVKNNLNMIINISSALQDSYGGLLIDYEMMKISLDRLANFYDDIDMGDMERIADPVVDGKNNTERIREMFKVRNDAINNKIHSTQFRTADDTLYNKKIKIMRVE